MLKTQLKKEQLETEIEILENKAKLKRQELRSSIAHNHNTNINHTNATNSHEYDMIPNRLASADAIKSAAAMYKPPINNQSKSHLKYDDVILLYKQMD